MSPRLLFLLSVHHLPENGRDRVDAQLAAARYSPRHEAVPAAAVHDDLALPAAA